MNVNLMYRDRDLGLRLKLQIRIGGVVVAKVEGAENLPGNAVELIEDLGLGALFDAMGAGDSVLFEVARYAVLTSLDHADEIDYRQAILRDCLEHREVIAALYDIAFQALVDTHSSLTWGSKQPDAVLSSSISVLTRFVEALKALRQFAQEHAASFASEGFRRLFEMLITELDDAYFDEIADHLARLRFRDGVLISANLGPGDQGISHVLRRAPSVESPGFWSRLGFGIHRSRYDFEVHPRDEAGAHALAQLRARGIAQVATALSQSADHIEAFLVSLITELAFYRGCVRLCARLTDKHEPVCFPEPVDAAELYTASGLYDGAFSLLRPDRVVGNDVRGDDRSLMMITGANRGGKSTLLRAIGLAQLMMQAGMFCCATAMRANVTHGIFTHYKREEDATMHSGKLDEELARMSRIADVIKPGSMMLFNESFSATNEREGSEIARQVIDALCACNIKVVFVTHQYDLARSLYERRTGHELFLRAERGDDTVRTFQLVEAEPLPTSFGEDLYRRIFTVDAESRRSPQPLVRRP